MENTTDNLPSFDLNQYEENKQVQSAEAPGISCNPVFKRYLNKLLLETEKLGLVSSHPYQIFENNFTPSSMCRKQLLMMV